MEQLAAAVIGAILGATLAIGTGWLLDTLRERSKIKQARVLLKTGLCDDLEQSVALYEKIADEWEKSKIIWFSTLNQLRESRQSYLNSRNLTVLIEDAKLRKRIFQYYSRSIALINDLEYMQKQKYDLMSKFNDLLRNIKWQNPSIEDQAASQKVTEYMKDENAQFINLEASIPDRVLKLNEFKLEAQNLLEDLQKPK